MNTINAIKAFFNKNSMARQLRAKALANRKKQDLDRWAENQPAVEERIAAYAEAGRTSMDVDQAGFSRALFEKGSPGYKWAKSNGFSVETGNTFYFTYMSLHW